MMETITIPSTLSLELALKLAKEDVDRTIKFLNNSIEDYTKSQYDSWVKLNADKLIQDYIKVIKIAQRGLEA